MYKLLVLFSIFIFFSCKKAEDRTCYKSSGEKTSLKIDLPNFSKLILNKKLDYTLVQDDSCYLKIIGGKNLLNFITWNEIESGKIEISNTNKCNFLRDLSKNILVEIHFKMIDEIRYEGSGMLNNKDTLKLNDLYFLTVNACGSSNLTLDLNQFNGEIAEGYADFRVQGKANFATYSIRDNGYCHTENLLVKNSINFYNKSQGDIYLNVDKISLSGYISSNGNVYYSGTPQSTDVKFYSEGKLIAL